MADRQEDYGKSPQAKTGATNELPGSALKPRDYKGVVVWDSAEVEVLPEFKGRDDDVWVCSFPRSGTTLTQEITYLIKTLDFEKANRIDLDDRFPIADVNDPAYPYYRGLAFLEKMESPRFIKSHFHYFLLPNDLKNGKGKIIYVARNPKACFLSLYKVLKYLHILPTEGCTIDEFLEYFINGEKVIHGPWWLHVEEFWQHRNDENILFLQFENIIQDKKGVIRKIAEFLNRDLTDEDVDRIYEHTSLESMKKNDRVNLKYMEEIGNTDKSVGGFINKGEVSGWRNEMTPDVIQRFDEALKEKLGHTDLKFE